MGLHSATNTPIYYYEDFDMKKTWGNITQHQQKEYEKKAAYLLERGYTEGKPVEQLAKEIYEKEPK